MPTATDLHAGKFKLTTESGADITFTLRRRQQISAVPELEAYRISATGRLAANVDNRKGTDMINMYLVSAFDEEGRQYTYSTATDAISLWKPSYQADGTYLMPSGMILDDAAGGPILSE